MTTARVFRCKYTAWRGYVMDGCGWEGSLSEIRLHQLCPKCGCFVREVTGHTATPPQKRCTITSPWDDCIVTYVVRNIDAAQDVNLHDALPKGWMLVSSERIRESSFFKLEFEVLGEVSDRDGVIVRTILERLGMRE